MRWEGMVKEGVWGGTTKTKSFLKSPMEAYYYRSFLIVYTYMTGSQMKSLYNMRDNASIRHLKS